MNATAPSKSQHFTPLRQIAGALSAALDLQSTLRLIAHNTTEVMRVDSCSIYLLDPDGDMLRLQATTGLAQRSVGRATLRVGEGMTGAAVAQGSPLYAAQAQDNPHFKWVDKTDEVVFQSLLAVPLRNAEKIVGALNVQTVDARKYNADEIELLSLIGDLVAGALARAQHYEQQQAKLQELEALALVSQAAISPIYLDDMLEVVTEMAAKTMNAAVCAIFLLDESGDYLEMRSAKQAGVPYRRRPPQAADAGIIGQAVQTKSEIYVPDVLQEPRFTNQEMARAEGLVSMLCQPLIVRDKAIGALVCYTAENRAFTGEQSALFSTLANQTALAIDNAWLVTNAAISREMHHRIKNNLQSVAMLMEMQLPEAEQLDTQHVLETNINRIRSIASVHEALSERGFHLVSLKEVVVQIADAVAGMTLPPDANIAISVQGEEILLPSRTATNLALAINELLQNALRHGFADKESGKVIISMGSSPTEYIFLVQDDGWGMPAQGGSGLGLQIVRALIEEDLQGSLKINALSPGSEFSIRLPRHTGEES